MAAQLIKSADQLRRLRNGTRIVLLSSSSRREAYRGTLEKLEDSFCLRYGSDAYDYTSVKHWEIEEQLVFAAAPGPCKDCQGYGMKRLPTGSWCKCARCFDGFL